MKAFHPVAFAGVLLVGVPLLAAAEPIWQGKNKPPIRSGYSKEEAECFDTQGASGLEVDVVEFSLGHGVLGTFRLVGKTGSRKWTEEGPGYPGEIRFHYEETSRDACTVQLYDPSRDVRIEMNFRMRRVFVRDSGSAQPRLLGEMDRTYHNEKGVWVSGGGTKYGNPPE